MSIRVAFPFFRQSYHLYHGALTAFELSLLDRDIQVLFYSAYNDTFELLSEISLKYPGNSAKIIQLEQLPMFQYFNLKNRPFPKPQKMIDKHAHLFEDMDVIVDTSDSLIRLIKVHGITKPKYISVFHGAGFRDRDFPNRLSKFQYFLLYGPKKYRRLDSLGLLTENNWAMVGYPKFDIETPIIADFNLFEEKRPIILYNPHFERRLSSWYKWGRKVLNYFKHSSKYNLIFAPHVEIKGRKKRWLKLNKYRDLPHMHIDLGSRSSINMTYTRIADLYLSDVSSQIVEILVSPRPCVFLNAHKVDWKDNLHYVHWNLGPVVDEISRLDNLLEEGFKNHNQYIDKQKKYFNDSIDLRDELSSVRSAKAIHAYIKKELNYS